MNMEKVNILHDGNGELTITHKQGSDPINLDGHRVETSIEGPAKYAEQRLSNHNLDVSKATVTFSYSKGNIKLDSDPHHPLHGVVVGKLVEDVNFKAFSINSGKQFSRKELLALFRFNRRFFVDGELCGELITELNSLQLNANQQMKEHDDDRGSMDYQFQQQVESSLPQSFELIIPVFVGLKPQRVEVDLRFQVLGNKVDFWLESPELQEIKDKLAEEVIVDEVDKLESLGLLCMEVV